MTARRLTIVVAILAVAIGPAAAQETEAAPAEQRLRQVVSLLDGWDPQRTAAYVDTAFAPSFRDRYPMEAHVNFLASAWDLLREPEVGPMETRASGGSVVLYSPVLDEWRSLGIQLEPDAPYRITGLEGLSPAPAPDGRTPVPMNAQELDAYARRLAEAELYSGALRVARGEDILVQGAYGEASKEFDVPNSPGTRFIMGSINKMFTAVAILQLVEAGEIGLDDPVADHLDGVLRPAVARAVTIRQLLTHTSGLGDFLFTQDMWQRNRANFRGLEDYLPLLEDDSLAFPPGTGWGYSNTGFLVLGAVIEAVSGQDYFAYVTGRVLEPAGMTDTGWPELDLVPENLASTYDRIYDFGVPRFRSDRYNQVIKGTPAGGGFSTLADMHAFALALMDGTLLSPETTARMLSPKPELGSPRYGFGAQIFGDGWVGHTGGGPGTSDFFAFHPETRAVVMVFGNQNGQSGAVARRAMRMALP